MGGAGSIHSLPDRISLDQFKKIVGTKSGNLLADFDRACNPVTKTISRETFLDITEITDCFVSHCWGLDELGRDNHVRAGRIYQGLQARGLRIWYDTVYLTGNITDHMCSGIDRTQLVIVCVTKRYVEKVGSDNAGDNCKKEFQYSDLHKTASKMIAVVMEPAVKDPKTWVGAVGFCLGNTLYIDFSKDENFDIMIEELYKRIVQMITPVSLHVPLTGSLISACSSSTSITTNKSSSSSSLNTFYPNRISSSNLIKGMDSFPANSSVKLTRSVGCPRILEADYVPLADLNVEEVVKLLQYLDMPRCEGHVRAHRVNGETLAEMWTMEDVEEVKLPLMKAKVRVLLHRIAEMRSEGVPAHLFGERKKLLPKSVIMMGSPLKGTSSHMFPPLTTSSEKSEIIPNELIPGLSTIEAVIRQLKLCGRSATAAETASIAVSLANLTDSNKSQNRVLFGSTAGVVGMFVDLLGAHVSEAAVADAGVKALLHLTREESLKAQLVSAGACKLLVDMLNGPCVQPGTAEQGLEAISQIAASSETNSETLGTGGACDVVVKLLRNFAENSVCIAESGLRAIRELTEHSIPNRQRMGAAGGCSALLGVLKSFGLVSPRTSLLGMWAIRLLSMDSNNKRSLLSNGAFEIVFSILSEFGVANVPLSVQGLFAAASLSKNDLYGQDISPGKSNCELLFRLLQMHGHTNVQLSEHGLAIICNLSGNRTCREVFGNLGASEFVVGLLREVGPQSSGVSEKGLQAVASLTADDATNVSKAVVAGICEVLIDLLKIHGVSVPSVAYAAFDVIVKLTIHNLANRKRIGGVTGGCEVLVDVMKKFGRTTSEMAQVGLRALRCLSDHSSNKEKFGSIACCEVIVELLNTFGFSCDSLAEDGVCVVYQLTAKAESPAGMVKPLSPGIGVRSSVKDRLGSVGCCELLVQLLQDRGPHSSSLCEAGLIALKNLSVGNANNRKKFGATGGCELVTALVRDFGHTSERIVKHGLGVIEALAIHDANRDKFMADSAGELVVKLLQDHSQSISVSEEGIAALRSLSENSATHREKLGNAGACEVVISHMKLYGNVNTNIILQGMVTLVHLSADSFHNKRRLGAAGAGELVVKLLQDSGRGHPSLAIQGLCTLRNLSDNPSNNEQLGSAGACELVVTLLKEMGASNQLLSEKSFEAIKGLAFFSNTNRKKIGAGGGCELVVSTLRMHGLNSSIVAQAGLWAIAALCDNFSNRDKLGQANACELVIRLLDTHGTSHVGTSEAGLAAIGNLASSSNANKDRLGDLGACEKVKIFLQAQVSNVSVHDGIAQYGCCAVIALVWKHTENTRKMRTIGMRDFLQKNIVSNTKVKSSATKEKAVEAMNLL